MRGKDRIRREGAKFSRSSSSSFAFPFTIYLIFFAVLYVVALSAFRVFGVSFRPVLLHSWRNPTMNSISIENPLSLREIKSPNSHSSQSSLRIMDAVSFPDFVLLFLNPKSLSSTTDLNCIYFLSESSDFHLTLPILSFSSIGSFIRCPLPPKLQTYNISFSKSSLPQFPPISPIRCDHLAYASVLDARDNSTVIFAKGHNLRPGRLSNPNSFECIFGWDLSRPKLSLSSEIISAAQEIFRCRTPLSILQRRRRRSHLPSSVSPFVSVRFKSHGSVPLPSVARPLLFSSRRPRSPKDHLMCVCTMLRNQARFLEEWIIYHSRVGVEKWFIYDNNSDDDLEEVVRRLSAEWKVSISLHEWPWLKTQEAGFAHCALRARESCKWVGFIDVDEFLYFPSHVKLHDVLRNYSKSPSVAELRVTCHSFGPSGRTTAPPEGVMVGYSCRISPPERHKSIVRPEALNPSLINVVHHFHLKDGMKYVNMDLRAMVINHYKYQVWEVFKEKFQRRVATYVADWQDDENVGSKDRAPGLGTKAVEPSDWANRFCDVNDTGLKNWVLHNFVDPNTGHLPW